MPQQKTRPSIDPTVYDLAVTFLADYDVSGRDDAREDAEWDLAGEIQNAIEDWMNDAELHLRIKENE